MRRIAAALVAAGGLGAAMCVGAQSSVRMVRQIDWTGRGVWLKADLHTHTRFSDGAQTVDEVVAAAAKNGCDVVAITDHSDAGLGAATPEYLDAIRAARLKTPSTIVVAGLEWNVPPGKGNEHAGVLLPAASERIDAIGPFK